MSPGATDELPERVRASVFVEAGAPLKERSLPLPTLEPGEALVRVTCCTLCGSDLHTYLGKRHGPAPSVLGHEALGRIVAFGSGEPPRDGRGGTLSLGDRVSWSVAASCGDCFFCTRELPQKCERLFKYGHELCSGHRALSGGLGECCLLVRGTAIFRVPEDVPDVVASSANCATATVAAAFRTVGGCREKVVVVQGAGMLGLTAAAMAFVNGAVQVIVGDVDARRLEMAKRFGASTVVDVGSGANAMSECVKRATDGRGADLILEMSGGTDAVREGLSWLRTGGQYVLVGAVKPVGAVALDIEQMVRRMWNLHGVHNYAPADLAAAIDFISGNWRRFPFTELVTGEYSLDEADAAFQSMVATGAIRVAVRP